MKRLLVIGAVALLSACGGQVVHAPVSVGDLVRPGTAPWLSIAASADKLEVRGLDHKLILDPSPDVSVALQSQLGAQLQPDYFQDLVVTCTSLATALRVDPDKSPDQLALDLGVHCQIWARGFDSNHDYKVKVSAAVASGSGDQGYAQALPTLLADSAHDLAGQLRSDLQKFATAH